MTATYLVVVRARGGRIVDQHRADSREHAEAFAAAVNAVVEGRHAEIRPITAAPVPDGLRREEAAA